jgi:processive 1,2-diacylglycerol beta-glucosyltransferase
MDVFNRQRRRGRLSARLSVAITDFDVHPLWIDARTDRYFASSDEAAHRLELRGIERARIAVTGIPVVPGFAEPVSAAGRRRLRAGLGLREDRICVLVSAGGFGVGRVDRAVTALLAAAGRAGGADLVVVAGRNEKLRAELAKLPVPRGVRLEVLGFVTNMHELMAAADVMVSKPGGLTSSECLARSLPMIIVDPIPGQEERNATHLLEGGAACQAATPDALDFRLWRLLREPARLAEMRRAAGRLARPRAAFEVADALSGRAGAP